MDSSNASSVERNVLTSPSLSLAGHTGAVTNIVYSNSGDKLITGSTKDGTSRIWTFLENYQQSTYVVLQAPVGEKPRSMARKEIPSVDTILWTHDDSRVVTLHSLKPKEDGTYTHLNWQQSIKVWDPQTGGYGQE